MAILEKDDIYIVAGATSGIGKVIGEFIKSDYYPIGGRNIQTLAEIASTANKKEFFIPGNLFDQESPVYNFFMEELSQKDYGGILQLFASIDMDPIPVEENGVIINDYYDPRSGQKWTDGISKEERKQIRREMADNQILFWKSFLEGLVKRESKKTLVIIYTNSIISKFYETHSLKGHSEYGRLKNTITKLIEQYREELEKKNVFIKNVILGVIDTPMFTNRGELSAVKTQKILEVVAPNFPLNGEEITITKPLNAKQVAKFLYDIGNIYPKAIPNKINLFHEKHLDIDALMVEFARKKTDLVKLIRDKHLVNQEKNTVVVDERVKEFLIQLRRDSLKSYYEKNKKRNGRIREEKLKNNITVGKKIVEMLSPQLSTETFLNTCLRLEGNYP